MFDLGLGCSVSSVTPLVVPDDIEAAERVQSIETSYEWLRTL